jgi:hypothetical protein
MTRKILNRTGLAAMLATAIVLVAFASFAFASGKFFDDTAVPITEVGATTKSLISVFRQPEPVAVPKSISSIFPPDKKTGKSFLGINPALARPAYPDETKTLPPVWLIPGANDSVLAFSTNAKGRLLGGGGGSVSEPYFANNGYVSWSPGNRHTHGRTQITVLLPDTIPTIQIKTQRKHKPAVLTTYIAHDNVVSVNLKYAKTVIVNGNKTRLQIITARPKKKHKH